MKKLIYSEPTDRFQLDYNRLIPIYENTKRTLLSADINILDKEPLNKLMSFYIGAYKATLPMLADDICLANVGKTDKYESVVNALVDLQKFMPLDCYQDSKKRDKIIDDRFNTYITDPELIKFTEKIELFHSLAKELDVHSLSDLNVYGYIYDREMYVKSELEIRYNDVMTYKKHLKELASV